MRVLIIGCGYVGAALAERLLQRGAEVHAVRRSAVETPPPALAAARWLTADITRRADVQRLAGRWDAVVNCVSSSRGGVDVYQRVFVEGSRHLREILAAPTPPLYLHLSSTSVYGQTDGAWVTEASPVQPAGDTARLLAAAEQLWLDAAAGGWPVVIFRLAGIYGPGRCYWLDQFLTGQARLGAGSERFLNMIHRDDAVDALLAALDQPAAAAAACLFNVADDAPVTPRELYGWLAQVLQRPLPPEAGPADLARPRKRALTHKRVSNLRLKTTLGWRPRHPTWREGFLEEIQCRQAAGLLDPPAPPPPAP